MKKKIIGILVVLAFFLTTLQVIGIENNEIQQQKPPINLPPSTPDLNVPDQGQVRDTIWISMISTDPENDEVKYFIEWGDGEGDWNLHWITSGVLFRISHKYKYEGDFIVRVKAKDYYDSESGWAVDEIEVPITLTKSNTFQNQIFIRFFENHPNLFPLLRQILGL